MSECPACGAECRAGRDLIAFCGRCGHRWLNRTETEHAAVEATVFGQNYSGYRPDEAYVKAVSRFIHDELLSRLPPPARILDVGCGAGDFMAAAQSAGYQVEGIDISRTSAEICQSRGLRCVADDLLTHRFAHQFDIVVMWDVVAHLRAPGAFLSRARELLAKGGFVVVKTPVLGDLSVRLANRFPRAAGALLGAPSHNQYFDRESLSALLSRTGFDPEWIRAGNARSRGKGGSLKRRLARSLRSAVSRLSGDGSVYLTARPKS
jgi:2-polyprenyl-3-methyl-5-hydroxy-6-metoxy-1,4-benzoquinol methylase